MTSKRGRQIVTARQQVTRAADAALVSPEELDRAIVLGQIAYFLIQHRRIGNRVAFKGGAIMKLFDGSPRFSGDLDGAAVAGRPIERRWIEEALWENPEAARVFLAKPRIVNATDRGISYPIIECRAVGSGRNPITVKLSINWSERVQLDAVWRDLEVHGVARMVKIPTVDDRERAAEKVRAFLERADVNDAFDLNQFSARDWKLTDWKVVARLVPIKLQNSTIKPGIDLLARFDEQMALVKSVWPGDMVVSGGAPAWATVEPGVLRFRDLLS